MVEHRLSTYLESLIFVSASPISLRELTVAINAYINTSMGIDEIQTHLDSLKEKYASEEFAFEIKEINGGYAFMTKGAYHELNGQVLKKQNKKKLTRTALETISIIAYKQPITKGEVEAIRGVSADYAIQKLMEKELIEIAGRSEALGKPLLYKTSEKFMNHFGLNSIEDLPKLKELRLEDYEEVGERAPDPEPTVATSEEE